MNYSPRKIFEKSSQQHLGKLNSLMHLMTYIYYWLLFFKNNNLKYAAISQRISFNSLSLFHIFFLFHCFLFCYFFANSHAQRSITSRIVFVNRILLNYCYVMYCIVSEIYIVGHFLEDCFNCYSQQIISAVVVSELGTKRAHELEPKKMRIWLRWVEKT